MLTDTPRWSHARDNEVVPSPWQATTTGCGSPVSSPTPPPADPPTSSPTWNCDTAATPASRTASAMGRTPGCATSLHDLDQNRIWCAIVSLACELTAWMQMLGLAECRPTVGTQTTQAAAAVRRRKVDPHRPTHPAAPEQARHLDPAAARRAPDPASPARTRRLTTNPPSRRQHHPLDRGTSAPPSDLGRSVTPQWQHQRRTAPASNRKTTNQDHERPRLGQDDNTRLPITMPLLGARKMRVITSSDLVLRCVCRQDVQPAIGRECNTRPFPSRPSLSVNEATPLKGCFVG